MNDLWNKMIANRLERTALIRAAADERLKAERAAHAVAPKVKKEEAAPVAEAAVEPVKATKKAKAEVDPAPVVEAAVEAPVAAAEPVADESAPA